MKKVTSCIIKESWLAKLKFWIPRKRRKELDELLEEAQKRRKELDEYIARNEETGE
jgi:hypothetical protein